MQSDAKSTSDSSQPIPIGGSANWPPSIVRLVVGALVAAGLSFLVLKTLFPTFVVPTEILAVPEQGPTWVYERLEKAKYEVDGKNFALVFGISGALLGVCCVLFAFGAKSIKAILVGAVASGGFGVLGAFLSNWMFNTMRLNSGKSTILLGISLDGMAQSILGYALLWSFIGLGVGLGIGAVRSIGKSVIAGVSGFVGGALGAMLYVILTSQISIGTVMNQVLPTGTVPQVIWLVFFMLVIAGCIALGSGEKRPKKGV